MSKPDGFDAWAQQFVQALDEDNEIVPSPAAAIRKHVVYADEAGAVIPAPSKPALFERLEQHLKSADAGVARARMKA